VLEETCKIAKQAFLNKEINLKQLFKKSYSPTHHFYNFERKQQTVFLFCNSRPIFVSEANILNKQMSK